jgi:hypothetical protein
MSWWNPAQLPPFPPVGRKVFISHVRADRTEVEAVVAHWRTQNVFIPQIIGAHGEDLINSDDAEYVIGQIRREYVADRVKVS